MAVPRLAVLSAVLVFLGAGAATAVAAAVTPRPGVMLSGEIKFPRAQGMHVLTGAKDGSRLKVALGFYGKCKGGGFAEVWSSDVAAAPQLRVRNGRFDGTLKGVARNLGDVAGRTGNFKWTFKGRFTDRTTAVGTVSGTAEIRVGGKTVSRCKTAKPASVRLTLRPT